MTPRELETLTVGVSLVVQNNFIESYGNQYIEAVNVRATK